MPIFENLQDMTVNFSDTRGIPILSEKGIKLGVLHDYFVDYEEVFPQILAIQYKSSQQFFYVHWKHINEFSYKKIVISESAFIGHSRTYPKPISRSKGSGILSAQFQGETVEYPPLGKVILDRQIVDTHGKKVVRVNDIQFFRAGKNFRVTHACIGIRSMFRRLGYEKFIDSIVKVFRPKSPYLSNESLINWKFVHAIPNKNIHNSVQLKLKNEEIKGLHPADLADILEDLDNHGREIIFSNLDPKLAAETLSEVEDDIQEVLLKNEKDENVAKIIEQMDTDDAADILSDMSEEKQDRIISNIEDSEIVEEIQELLEYDEDTAGGLMSTEVFEISPNLLKDEILEYIQENHEELETLYDLYIVDKEQKLLGSCELRDLLICKDNVKIETIMNRNDIKSVGPDQPWKQVAQYMSKYNLINVPVLNDENKILGIISVDDILPWLLHEKK